MKKKHIEIQYTALKSLHGDPIEDKLVTLTLSNPKKANALNDIMLSELIEALQEINNSQNIRVLLLKGEGRHFCAGADLLWMKGHDNEKEEQVTKLLTAFKLLENLPMPTIAIAKGRSIGGGVGLVACCDYALATTSATFRLSELSLGILPAVILPYLRRKIDRGHLSRLILTCRAIDSHEAIKINLINAIYDHDIIEEEIKKEVNKILMNSPYAQRCFKDFLKKVEENQCQQGDYTIEALKKLRKSKSAQEGLHSILNKKNPTWCCQISEKE